MSRYHDEFTPPVDTDTDKVVRAINALSGRVHALDATIKARPEGSVDLGGVVEAIKDMSTAVEKMCQMMKPVEHKPMTGLSVKRLQDGSWDVKVER